MSEGSNKNKELNEGVESSRRKFLKRAGEVAVYTPPIMLAMSSPSFANIATSSGASETIYAYPPYRLDQHHYNRRFRRFRRRPSWDD